MIYIFNQVKFYFSESESGAKGRKAPSKNEIEEGNFLCQSMLIPIHEGNSLERTQPKDSGQEFSDYSDQLNSLILFCILFFQIRVMRH